MRDIWSELSLGSSTPLPNACDTPALTVQTHQDYWGRLPDSPRNILGSREEVVK